ncbi:MAG: nuclear transport factor 2 family protein [Phenylobacterium sp.]|nr:nuclear transport factor 2 family protein [Phenylobacterium sp.]
MRDAFLKHSAPEAIVFQPDEQKVHETFPKQDPDKGGPPLVWWPLWAGIARSGDLGFTTGPYSYDGQLRGYYFTVWKKQADGGWKWVYDGGPPSSAVGAAPQGSQVTYLPVSTAKGRYPETAFAEVRAAEATLADAARIDAAAAYKAVLSPDGRVSGSRAAPTNTPEGQAAELATRAGTIDFAPLGGEVSLAGDLAWTYGDAAWVRDGQGRQGHYVRIWQLGPRGWRLVYDMILASPPKA